ncbi:hypothetical protein Tco_0976984 [Tanacetum coccineum]|uniref:Retrovirus-related Pol polyprotein from transposon TNT 1-94 n=1 Tax=Tanacetum coccineum TaxID=301880 RepID=A0ABQ5EJA3_9ASTR
METTERKLTLGKLDVVLNGDPQEINLPLGGNVPFTKTSVKCLLLYANLKGPQQNWGTKFQTLKLDVFKCRCTGHALVSGLRSYHGYGDYVMGDSVISRVYYVEGLGHNLFSVRQFCDSNLEVAFRKHTCFVRDGKCTDILRGSRGTNLYTISIDEMMKSSPICLQCQCSKSKSWLWHLSLKPCELRHDNDLLEKIWLEVPT